jgi:hypothetical protein
VRLSPRRPWPTTGESVRGGSAGLADEGFLDPQLLANHGGAVRTAIEHRIGQIKAKFKMASKGLTGRNVMQAGPLWEVACALYNRQLRLYGPTHHLQ